ncbi:RluA family pseudouridine synthase [Dellaglioa carnosa]|uniref:RluA family pseudouridine synthase n=1 Tax=Dellaglioa carnosa TaxID=2995136 RepID=UPI0022A82205|nr:RluA family pseudouridine synthase [Dellaglioa carnosa]MCZ2493022.1 RluA family pseudouridine synthase [Dellaglioa carnosa]
MKDDNMQFTLTNNGEGTISLRKFLIEVGVSKRLIARIKQGEGQVRVNQKNEYWDYQLIDGDEVVLTLPEEPDNDAIHASDEPLNIVFEDENWLVVDKPAGMVTVPGPSNEDTTLVNRVKGHLIATGSSSLVPHVITRLDRFTSGLVLLAKHGFAHSLIAAQLSNGQLEKSYLAIVEGDVKSDQGDIKEPIGKKEGEIRRSVMAEGKASETTYKVVTRFPDYTLVDVKLVTGRTHQIRVHFDFIHHALVGDALYDGPMDKGIERQALHAAKLSFEDPFTGKKLAFESELPDDMARLLK